jgi:hypothetical protein
LFLVSLGGFYFTTATEAASGDNNNDNTIIEIRTTIMFELLFCEIVAWNNGKVAVAKKKYNL